MITEKNIQTVLKYCMEHQNGARCVHNPVRFTDNFPKLTTDEVFRILDVLDSRGLIELQIASMEDPDSQNIYAIHIPTAAYDYLVGVREARRNYWKNWRWNILAAVFTAIVAAILGAALSRFCDMLWPLPQPTAAVQQQTQE